jgi:1-acyl-sn-glycerol-3-phosphate acyltransferase
MAAPAVAAMVQIYGSNLMLHLRSSIFVLGYLAATGVYGTLALFLWILPSRWRHRIIISWTTVVVYWLRLTCGVRFQLHGRENIQLDKDKRPFVVLSKHQSTWETLYLQNLFYPASTILKKELLRIPFFGWGLRALNPIGIDRSNPRDALRQVKAQGIARLSAGFNVLLFPEGTRIKAGERGKYARSGADIACDAGVAVVPVAVNAGYCWPPGSFLKYPGTIQVVVGSAIETHGRSSREIMQEAETWIEDQMASMLTGDLH